MKYYNIDLTQFVPYGIPLNGTDKVESKNYINEFFLQGFTRWYNTLFTVDKTNILLQDYSRGCTAPYSLSSCKYCTNSQLEKFIQNEGFVYYSANDHDVNAKFVYDLFRYTYGTQEYLSSIAQYVSNNPDVDAEILYDGYDTYEYGIRLYGDILGAENVHIMIDRITEHLKILGTVHTTLKAVEFEDTSSEIATYAACVGDNACMYYDSYLKEIAPPVRPDLDVFNPEIPFCIENTGNLEITVKYATLNNNIKISSDNTTWSDYTSDSEIRLKPSDRVYIKSDYVEDTSDEQHFKFIGADGIQLRARGNIASLIYGTNNAYVNSYTSTEQYCYNNLFKNCNGLTQGPDLPATTLANNCYSKMFQYCSDLTQVPELPATTLANNCYAYMFEGCGGLTQAPALPATNLVVGCYYAMFKSCINLTRAPDLPATWIKRACYTNMFYGCTKLNYIKCLATDMVANSMTGWVTNVAATGTFECDNKKYFTLDSTSGIPTGWTITEINPDIEKPDLDTFDPNVPFCIENVGDVPVEVGLYNHHDITAMRTNCKISYDLQNWQDYALVRTTNSASTNIGRITLQSKGDRVYIKADKNDYTNPNYPYPHTRVVVFDQTYDKKIRARGNIVSLNKGTNDNYKTDYLTFKSGDAYSYYQLFNDCTNLIQAPELPMTNTIAGCYCCMFQGCTRLTGFSDLPATILADSCYHSMFYGCTSLTQAPELPATTLATYCYSYMFQNCINITRAPELLATTLVDYCYYDMFKGCRALNYVKCLATDISASSCVTGWLSNVKPIGDFYTPAATNWLRNEGGIPSGWTRHDINPDPDPGAFDPTIPFYIENVGDVPVEVGLYNHSANTQVRTNCKISYDNSTWQNYSLALAINPTDRLIGKIALTNKGDRVYIKADLNTTPSTSHYTHLTVLNESANTKISARGNIASLNKGSDDAYKTDYLTAADHGYVYLFSGCTSLIQMPELPATTLSNNCYENMFRGCTSLVQVLEELPATTLAGYCYYSMFLDCTSLNQAPKLPATTLTDYCYTYMFNGCTSLTRAPELPATKLTFYCYYNMFGGCTSLSYIKCLATNISMSSCTTDWLSGVSSTGDFYTPATTNWKSGTNGIPSGWTRHDI